MNILSSKGFGTLMPFTTREVGWSMVIFRRQVSTSRNNSTWHMMSHAPPYFAAWKCIANWTTQVLLVPSKTYIVFSKAKNQKTRDGSAPCSSSSRKQRSVGYDTVQIADSCYYSCYSFLPISR